MTAVVPACDLRPVEDAAYVVDAAGARLVPMLPPSPVQELHEQIGDIDDNLLHLHRIRRDLAMQLEALTGTPVAEPPDPRPVPPLAPRTPPAYLDGRVPAMLERIAGRAADAGLHPHTRVETYRGARLLMLDAHRGPDSLFGVFRIGARSGRFLGGWVKYGNEGRRREFRTGQEAAAVLRELADAEATRQRWAA